MKLAAVSVDLDTLPHYCRIHGISEDVLSERAKSLVHAVALPRLRDLFARTGWTPTFFVIGETLADPGMSEAIAQAHRSGAEIASHSHRHDYGMADALAGQLDEDFSDAEQAIVSCTGQRPVGFRSPGYSLSAALYRALESRAYRYDASVFPALPYYVAKALVMGAGQLVGRPSGARLDSPGVLLAPRHPYRPDAQRPYRRGGGSVLELPMAIEAFTRIPFIGTFITWAPQALVRAAYASLRREAFVSLELHALDVLDLDDGIAPVLGRHQPDVGIAHTHKLERLARVLQWMAKDFEPVTLEQAAQRLA